MKIRVLHGWIGDTSQTILKGDYDADDPRLFGKADYLVRNRHAEVAPDAGTPISHEEAETLPDAETTEAKFGIENMTLTELKVLATRYQLEFNSRSTKAELIALIRNAEDTSDAEAD